jgi:hypothetical protein
MEPEGSDSDEEHEGHGGLHVFNASSGGTNPLQWASYLEALLPIFQPHAVIAVFFLRSGTVFATSLEVNSKHIEPIRERYAAKLPYERLPLEVPRREFGKTLPIHFVSAGN